MSDVPCNGCRACCRDQVVLPMEEDESRLPFLDFITDTTPDGVAVRVLNARPNGECVHLSETGCAVYENRPEICRAYDCRKQFLIMTRNERRQLKNQSIWDAARARIKTLDAVDLADVIEYGRRAFNSHKRVLGLADYLRMIAGK